MSNLNPISREYLIPDDPSVAASAIVQNSVQYREMLGKYCPHGYIVRLVHEYKRINVRCKHKYSFLGGDSTTAHYNRVAVFLFLLSIVLLITSIVIAFQLHGNGTQSKPEKR
ncbi:hypothetical protein SNEBB_009091 [Seison nebaliae]|nr:hypothetical protein SNEBB_009091 [Seison nebaliae]